MENSTIVGFYNIISRGADSRWCGRGVIADRVREWPFDTSTVLRFARYLLIPLGSWFGGAMVERVVDTWLG